MHRKFRDQKRDNYYCKKLVLTEHAMEAERFVTNKCQNNVKKFKTRKAERFFD